MAEVIGLVASVTSLIAFTSQTSKACNKLAKSISLFENAPADIQKIGAELLDLVQILDLFQSVLQPLRDGKAQEQVHADFIQRSLARVRDDVQKVADLLFSVQSKSSGRNTKGRAKWVFFKEDVALMMTVIDRQKQTLLMQMNMLSIKIAHTATTELENSRNDIKRIGSRVDESTEIIRTSTSASVVHIEDHTQSSMTSLGNSIRDEIHRTMSSTPRETNISRRSLETLSMLVSEIVTSQIESRTSEDPSNHPGGRQYTERPTTQTSANGPQTDSIEYVTAGTQVTVDRYRRGHPNHLHREEPSLRFTSRTSIQKMTSFFGTVIIRRSTAKQTLPDFDPEFAPEITKVEINFFPATWLRSWTGCGAFLARMGLGIPKFDFSLAVARTLECDSDPWKKSFEAVIRGDVDALKELLQLKVAYPTDRDPFGDSLLTVAAFVRNLDICKLLLQQGAGIDINMPTLENQEYPIQFAIRASMGTNNRDFVRFFLSYDADITVIDGNDCSVGASALYAPSPTNSKTQEAGKGNGGERADTMENFQANVHPLDSLFRFLVESEPAFDVHQRDRRGRTLLMQTRGQPRQIYEELLRLGSDVKAVDGDGNTILHHFFWNNLSQLGYEVLPGALLNGGEILALLIQAGADPQAINRFGQRPQDYHDFRTDVPVPRVTIQKLATLAIWHEALRICGLSESEYCDCPAHRGSNINSHDSGSACQPCPDRFNGSLRFDTFEDEMSAALRTWDKNAAQEFYQGNSSYVAPHPLSWEPSWAEWDTRVHEVLTQLQIRLKNLNPGAHTDPIQPIENRLKDGGEDDLERDETQTSDGIHNVTSEISSQDMDSVEAWETSSSASGEEGWESAPEM